jgi:hypothetical protein
MVSPLFTFQEDKETLARRGRAQRQKKRTRACAVNTRSSMVSG